MSSAKVVVVEDEPTIASAVAARLRADGHTVEIAGDGPSGVALCRRVQPDLVVLDLMRRRLVTLGGTTENGTYLRCRGLR